jgi:hypothetical protein
MKDVVQKPQLEQCVRHCQLLFELPINEQEGAGKL